MHKCSETFRKLGIQFLLDFHFDTLELIISYVDSFQSFALGFPIIRDSRVAIIECKIGKILCASDRQDYCFMRL